MEKEENKLRVLLTFNIKLEKLVVLATSYDNEIEIIKMFREKGYRLFEREIIETRN